MQEALYGSTEALRALAAFNLCECACCCCRCSCCLLRVVLCLWKDRLPLVSAGCTALGCLAHPRPTHRQLLLLFIWCCAPPFAVTPALRAEEMVDGQRLPTLAFNAQASARDGMCYSWQSGRRKRLPSQKCRAASPLASMLWLRSKVCSSASRAAGSNHCSPAPPQGERLYYTVKRSPGGQVGEGKHATWSSNCTVRIASGWLVISRWLAVIA